MTKSSRHSWHSPVTNEDLRDFTSTHPISCRCVACCALSLDQKPTRETK